MAVSGRSSVADTTGSDAYDQSVTLDIDASTNGVTV